MNRYENGKIYKIVDREYTLTYVGSTTEPLSKRLERHHTHFKSYLKGHKTTSGCLTSFQLFKQFGFENCKIELIENYPCQNKEELKAREGFYQQSMDCVNKLIAGRTRKTYVKEEVVKLTQWAKEYKGRDPERWKKYSQDYYINNKAKIQEKRYKQCCCDCGGRYIHQNRSLHQKTKKHQDWLNKQNEE